MLKWGDSLENHFSEDYFLLQWRPIHLRDLSWTFGPPYVETRLLKVACGQFLLLFKFFVGCPSPRASHVGCLVETIGLFYGHLLIA